MRLMYLPNEPEVNGVPFRQAAGRNAFSALKDQGRIAALEIYSYYGRLAALGNGAEFERELAQRVADFAPDIVFVQHVPKRGLPDTVWRRVKQAAPNAALVYHEADAFGWPMKRLHRSLWAAAATADLTLLCSLGYVYDTMRKHGLNVGYLPHCFDAGTFAQLNPENAVKRFDAVMIGNRVHSRWFSGVSLPGGAQRMALAKLLSGELGSRFGLYGLHWDGVPSFGPVPFVEQETAIQSARISVNWDHFNNYPYYFSDRLPISLAAGVPHVTSYHPGYEQFFSGCPGLYWAKSVGELMDCVRWLISRPDEHLLAEGLAARAWVSQRLEGRVVYGRAFEMSLKELHRLRSTNG